MKKAALVAVVLVALVPALRADRVTLPAAASLVGGNPFFSDVRVFNTSYTSSLDVTATYRCFINTTVADCPATPPVLTFTLAPREARAFNDMVASADGFNAHDTAGGVEFDFSGSENQLVVTSRLFSTSPQNSVGMFIPGLDESDAHPTTVLTSIRHTPASTGVGTFRTNVGVFNPEDSSVNVTFTIFDNGTNQVGSPVTRLVGGHSGAQISGIFEAAGAGSVTTSNAVIVVSSATEVFTYAAVLDNNTADPIFVVGAEDQPQQPITPIPSSPTATPTQPGPSPTPTQTATPGAPTPTHTPTNTRTPLPPTATPLPNQVNIGPGMTFSPSNITITAGQTVIWVWSGSLSHSTTSDTGIWDSFIQQAPFFYSHTFSSPGVFPYYCFVHGFPGGVGMSGTVTVTLP